MTRKTLFPTFCVLTLILSACAATIPEDQDTSEEQVEEVSEEEREAEEAAWEQSVEEQVSAGEDESARTIRVSVRNWEFSPSTITVKKGERVTLELVGTEGAHGFAVPGLGINISVTAGQTVTIQIPTDTAGSFEFFCSIPCGSGHQNMRGTIIIQE